MPGTLQLTRPQILAFRRRVGALDERLPLGRRSLRTAAWAGLQDSMPRAALLSIHARVRSIEANAWEDPSLVQLWGPRFSAYVVAARDVAVFTMGRLPERGAKRDQGEELAVRLRDLLDGRKMSYAEAGRVLGVNPNQLRYAAPTGTVLIRWDGAARPIIWSVPAPDVDSRDARLELARRYLHVFGPATGESFRRWAGIGRRAGPAVFEALGDELVLVRTPVGESWILASDEPTLLTEAPSPAPARLLPSGDAYYLLHGADRELLVPEPGRRDALWTSRVWPGALLVDGEIAGTWRRARERVTISPWRRLARPQRDAVEAEAASLPLPGVEAPITVEWG